MKRDIKKIDHEIRWASAGSKMPFAEAKAAEKRLLTEANCLESRIKLLGYYFLKALDSATARAARYRHICWMIQNHPGHFVASEPWVQLSERYYSTKQFAYARELWNQQIQAHPSDADIWGNFGLFVIQRDLDFGLTLLQAAWLLDETNHSYPSFIILFCSFEAKSGPLAKYRKKYARLALKLADAATNYKSSYLANKHGDYRGLTLCALYVNEFELATKYVTSYEKIQKRWSTRDSFRNAVLGTIALRNNDFEKAAEHLLNIKPGEQIDYLSFTLANEMLACNQHDVVAQFIERLLELQLVDFKLEYWEYWLNQVKRKKSPLIGNFLRKLKLNSPKT